jgi:uncharacterized membrane protein YvbJ
MPYCSVCGFKTPEDALFCPNCGNKLAPASKAGFASSSSEEVREAFNRMSAEMEKAFSVAAKEVQDAFQVARDNIQRAVFKEPVVCPNCGEKNFASAVYCFKCGKLLPEKSSEAKPSS